jgi:hypothetical protein
MKVLIIAEPREHEIDGVNVGLMEPGTLREVSSAIGSWLIAEGYALPEMRQQTDRRQLHREPGPGHEVPGRRQSGSDRRRSMRR